MMHQWRTFILSHQWRFKRTGRQNYLVSSFSGDGGWAVKCELTARNFFRLPLATEHCLRGAMSDHADGTRALFSLERMDTSVDRCAIPKAGEQNLCPAS